MTTTTMPGTRVLRRPRRSRWWLWVIVVAVLGVGGYYAYERYQAASTPATPTQTTTAITRGNIASTVSATGNLAPATQLNLNLSTSGNVKQIDVKVGDSVTVGQALVRLDTTDLELTLKTDQASLESAQFKLAQTKQGATDAEIVAAQAKVTSAQAALDGLYSGPTSAELAEAQSRVRTAQINLEKAQTGPTDIEIANAKNKVETAKNSLWSAQSNRDAVCGRAKDPDQDTSCNQARAAVNNGELNVQTAQNDLQTLLAGPDANDIRIAQENVRQAELALAQSREGPTGEQVASAQANLVQAQSSLTELQAGPDALDIQQAELAVRQAEAKLEQSRLNLAKATLTAPFAGVVTAVNVVAGQAVGASSNPIQIADLSNLQIETQVSELDRAKLKVGQPVNIKLEALSGVTLQGEISRINPTGTSTSGVVNYGVLIKVTKSDPNAAAGMTATLTIVVASKQGVLIVPNRAIQTVNNQKVVTVLRDGTTVLIPVTTGVTDGSKTEVSSADLKEGDEVVTVSSTTSATSSTTTQGGPGMNPMGILGGGGPPPGR